MCTFAALVIYPHVHAFDLSLTWWWWAAMEDLDHLPAMKIQQLLVAGPLRCFYPLE